MENKEHPLRYRMPAIILVITDFKKGLIYFPNLNQLSKLCKRISQIVFYLVCDNYEICFIIFLAFSFN